MANIKSAKRRIKVIAKKTLRNKMVRSQMKTAVKKLLTVVETGDKNAAALEYRKAVKAIDNARSKGVIHKNNASRHKSRLALRINKMA